MFLLTAGVVLAQVKPNDLFDSCVASLRKMKEYSVHIETTTAKDGQSRRAQFDISVNGSEAFLRHLEPKSGFLDRSDRRYLIRGDRLTGYDAVAGERLRRTAGEGKTPALKMAGSLGDTDLSLKLALDPSAMRQFLGGFRLFPDWRISHSGEILTIARYTKGGATLFRFSGKGHLLTDAELKSNGAMVHWTFDFQPAKKIALDIPSDTRPVVSFSEREAPPKYKSAEARQIVERMLKAYGLLTHATVDVRSDDGNSRLILSGRQVRETDPGDDWAYDGISLSMRNTRTGQFYRGKAKRVILSEYVTKVGGLVDPLMISILAQHVPYLELFPSSGVVRLVGSLGSTADIIEVKTSKLKVSLFVRRDNHLLDSIESETVDRPGRTQTRTQRWFKYSRIGEKTDIASFRLLPDNSKVLPLPKLKILGET